MESQKIQVREDIQKSYRKYLSKLRKQTNTYRGVLHSREEIYEESRKLVDVLLNLKEEDDIEKVEISIEALKKLLEDFNSDDEEEDEMFYPELGDPKFGYHIYHKKEFNQYKIPALEGDSSQLDKMMKEKCSMGVKTSPTQKLLKNFLSPYSPYNSLMVYHGVGVGKTCASIMIAENYKKQLLEKGKKIFIILPPSIQENYKRQIIDISKITRSKKEIQKQCTGNSYMTDKFIEKIKKLRKPDGKYDMDEIQRVANRLIDKHYEFLGYEQFVNKVIKMETSVLKKNPETKKKKGKELVKTRKKLVNKLIQEYFSDSLIIIDEAHNITSKENTFRKGAKVQVQEDSLGSISNQSMEGGASRDSVSDNSDYTEEKLKYKTWDETSDTETIMTSDDMSTISQEELKQEQIGKQFPPIIKKVLKTAENVKLVLLTATPMFNTAEEMVDLVNLMLINDRRPTLNIKEIFKDGELTRKGKKIFTQKISGYISYLRGENPINFPQKLEPLKSDGLYLKPYPRYDINGDRIEGKLDFLKIIDCEMSSIQWEVYQKYFDTRKDEGNYFDTVGLQVCNLVCVDNIDTKQEDMLAISNYFGTGGFDNIVDKKVNKNEIQIEFKNDRIKDLFQLDKIHHISSKLKKIIECIEKSQGICFVYSQFLWSGIYPLAMALELLGYSNYSGQNILPKSYKIPKKKIKVKDGETGQMVERNMKYLIIKGGSSEDFDKYKKNDEINNTDGSLLKIVLGTKAAGEGLNIYYVREVHVMEPWFHLNRLEQIIGRGIRNCSHKDLPLEKRNVSVFLYCVTEPKTKKREVRETLDMKLYRVAEEKIGKIGRVMDIVKSSAIDCHLNQEGNLFVGNKWNQPVKMLDSRGNKRQVIVEDKPYSSMCSYSEKCEIKCLPGNKKVNEARIDMTTYRKEFSEDNIKECMEEIKLLFSQHEFHIVFTLKEIMKYLKIKMPLVSEDIIFQSLDLFVKGEEKIYDYHDNLGIMIYRGSKIGEKYYIFQPYNTSEELPIILRKLRFDSKIKKIRLEKLIQKKTLTFQNVEEEVDEIKILQKFMKRFETDSNKMPNANMITFISKNLEFLADIKCSRNSAKCIHNIMIEKYLDYYNPKDRKVIIELFLRHIWRVLQTENMSIQNLVKKVKSIKFYENDKLQEFKILDQVLSLIPYEDADNEVRKSYLRGLLRYLIYNHLEYNQDRDSKIPEDYFGYSYGEENKLVFISYEEGEFKETDKKIVRQLSIYKDRLRVNMDNYFQIYGFCESQSKNQKSLKFKIVEKSKEKGTKKTQEVTGSTCGPAYDLEGHINILKKLDSVEIVSELQKKSDKIGKKTDVCETLELFLRILDELKSANYFFNYERALVWKNKY